MWTGRYLSRIDYRVILTIVLLLLISLVTISAYTTDGGSEASDDTFFTAAVIRQLKAIAIGAVSFLFFAGSDYRKLREWTWFLYAFMLLALIGVFFTDSIQRVHRWYRVPLIGMNFQPSEFAKLVVVITLSWFLERNSSTSRTLRTVLLAISITFLPLLLILKQPDLGTALLLFPISLVLFYFGDIHPLVIRWMSIATAAALVGVALIFLGIIPHDDLRPIATKFLKDYQFDRLSPHTHHQHAASTAIAIGGLTGKGWRKSTFTAGGWLPEPYTDSIFPAFGEEFGFLGVLILMALFYALLYFSFQVAAVAADPFGRLLSVGTATYLAMHMLVNVGMMSGLLPITGVPLTLLSYGGSSTIATMTALGILQSIYSRRFMF